MILNLISGPRNVSTALMYSFAQHPGFRVIDEPFYGHYLKASGVEHPGREEVLHNMPLELNEILPPLYEEKKKHLFLKNMAHHLILIENRGFLKDMKNLFLIRDPAKLIYSFAKVIKEPTVRDIGVKDEYTLYQEVSAYQEPVIIDSDELLKNPEFILRQALDALGFNFNSKMLRWQAGPLKEDGIWAKYWYDNVHKSTGFAPYKEKNVSLKGHLLKLYEEVVPYYEKLYQRSIKN